MGVHHHPVAGSCFYYTLIMIDSILSVVRQPVRKASGIAGLYIADVTIGIPLHRFVELAFVVRDVSARFVMPDNDNSFLLGVAHNFINVKIGTRFGEIKILRTTPTFPTGIPSFEQNALNLIGGCKIDVLLRIGSGSSMSFIHFPRLYSKMHPPPHT